MFLLRINYYLINLSSNTNDLKYWKNTKTLDNLIPELLQICDPSEADIAVIGSKKIDLDSMPSLRGIFKCGVGVDNVPFEKAKSRFIEICLPSEKTRNYIFEETANFAVYLILKSLFADLGNLDQWTKTSRSFLGKRKVLVMGLGNIGKQVVRKLDPSLQVLTFDILHNLSNELRPLIVQSDIVSIHLPLNDSTLGFFDSEKLSWMKDGATLVNTARGPIVDESALYDEICSGRLRAAFDVFWEEPYHGRLKSFHPHSFCMSPHVASNCQDFLDGLAKDFYSFKDQLDETV